MKILNDEMAVEAIDEVCKYLERSKMKNCQHYCIEKESADLARKLSIKLLDAASANGQGGCPLCRS